MSFVLCLLLELLKASLIEDFLETIAAEIEQLFAEVAVLHLFGVGA